MKVIFLLSALVLSSPVMANCISTGSVKTCYEDNGNTHNVQKVGNTTTVHGNNSQMGSRSNQITTTALRNGNAADGNSWNSNTKKIGSSTSSNSTNSQYESFSMTCNLYGCY